MDDNQTPEQNQMNDAPGQQNSPKEKSAGGVISTIIVVVIILIGAVYLFTSREDGPELPEMTPEEITTAPDAQKESLLEQATTDDITAIEEDLDMTDLEGLDAELEAIEAELAI